MTLVRVKEVIYTGDTQDETVAPVNKDVRNVLREEKGRDCHLHCDAQQGQGRGGLHGGQSNRCYGAAVGVVNLRLRQHGGGAPCGVDGDSPVLFGGMLSTGLRGGSSRGYTTIAMNVTSLTQQVFNRILFLRRSRKKSLVVVLRGTHFGAGWQEEQKDGQDSWGRKGCRQGNAIVS